MNYFYLYKHDGIFCQPKIWTIQRCASIICFILPWKKFQIEPSFFYMTDEFWQVMLGLKQIKNFKYHIIPPSPGHKNKLDASQKTHSEKYAVVVHFILNEGHKKETRSLFIKNNCSPCFKRWLFFLQKLKQTINGYTNFNCLTNVNAFFHHIQIQIYFKPHVS